MSFLAKLLLGSGTLKPKLRAALESEGLVLIEEGLSGSVRYKHFKAPGKRFNGKVTGERMGLGISRQRCAVYCRSGRGKLVDTAFSDPRWKIVEVSLHDDDTVSFRVDYDQAEDMPKISGEVTIRARTPNAARIVKELNARLGRS